MLRQHLDALFLGDTVVQVIPDFSKKGLERYALR